ncbi:trifunctional serine/threonine-protein kinase/ATP-binding protein/sensor histidine kinase [Cystobacter ferrugineus]|uniref:histidine kinase n=1 Tax=Cystobacter ferrugineus TaxID=83449 RepID=A0A1L9BA74_9BACT|nr:trifunctional serine/threonine-protein kinase/ATP-binding protein/sensor histidine kinase [Cystobacter ferrugineus]OJH39093.1 histidine kinase [Cystobacter ferrugineus]
MLQLPGYALLGLLQSTSSNLLYRALREVDGQPVILKTPRSDFPGARERAHLQHEYTLLQRLRDTPGVIQVHAYELLQERPVLVLENVGGTSLSEHLEQPFPLARFLPIALDLCTTLAEVHRRGVIHKDIKPGNILLSSIGQPWLIDFGISTLQRTQHVEAGPATLVEGTPAYMSPEQTGRMNRALDYRTDLYSLGITFYQLLTGRLPFAGSDLLEWFHAHLAQAPLPPHQVVRGLPPALSALVMKLLSKRAEDRYQGAEGLRFDLECVLNGEQDFPLGQKDVPARFLLPQRLYGRHAEVATLREAFERVAQTGRPEWVLVRGYSGIGKSSVVKELHQPVLHCRGFFLRGKFDQNQRDEPYATVVQALRGLIQHLLASSDEEVASWRQRLLHALEGQAQVLLDLVPQLELILGKQPAVEELPADAAQHRVHRLFQRLLSVFATGKHPLVLFLDDLQWADAASLALLQYLMTHPDTPSLLWVGAYRDNEVTPTHPLMLTLATARKAGTRFEDIHLGALSLEQTRQLVADALPGAQEDMVHPLSALVWEKTAGNPFFLLQLLQTLHQEELVTRALEGGWRWDEAGVKACGYSDNVVDFMAGRLRQLPPDTQHLLQLAAGVGNAFPLSLLALLAERDVLEVERCLEPALMEGLVVQASPLELKFPHDRIQQAAHGLTPKDQRQRLHLRIGRLLLRGLSPEELEERLFDVVGQLNAGVDLLEDVEERTRLAHLNARAGFRARNSTAHQSAVSHLGLAFSLLPGDPWETHPELAFKLRLAHASSKLVLGRVTQALQLVDEASRHARTRLDIASAYLLKSRLLTVMGDAQAAMRNLLECLERFGIVLPPSPSAEELRAAGEELEGLLERHSVESLLDLPTVTDPDVTATQNALASLATLALFISPGLSTIAALRSVVLSIRHGNTEASANSYVLCAIWYCLIRQKYEKAHAFGKLAHELIERHPNSIYRGRVLAFYAPLASLREPFAETHKYSLAAFEHALRFGDSPAACVHGFAISRRILVEGRELSEAHQEIQAFVEFSRKSNYRIFELLTRYCERLVQQLRGLTPSFSSPDGEGFDEESAEAVIASGRSAQHYNMFLFIKLQSRFIRGDYEQARRARALATPEARRVPGDPAAFAYQLYGALTLAACYRNASPEEQREFLSDIETHHQRLAGWARSCPANYLAAERLVAAELARLSGNTEGALRAYEASLSAAREYRANHLVGLICELAARFCKDLGLPSLTAAYIRQAHEGYVQWGAHGKAHQLEEQWPQLLVTPSKQETTTTGTGVQRIDALAVIKAQQAISCEIVLERLVATLMRVALESAGAQRGAFLLLQDDALQLVALQPPSERQGEALHPHELPLSLLAYVRRTGEHVLLDDTTQPHPFSADVYFSSSSARSVLCLPVRRQDSLQGLLYLENSLSSETFSHGRLSLLEHLASQAAISIENARLYSDVRKAETALRHANEELEARVQQRTHELRQAQARLVETARRVGMAEVASSVLHDVGNALTSIVVDTALMRGAAATSRVNRFRQAAILLEDNRARLAEFLTQDARGRHMVDYLIRLSEELEQEHTSLSKNLEALDSNVARVRAIVESQQAHATSTLLLEECDLGELVDEALRLQQGALFQAGITVSREVQDLPPVKTDKHKVLTILLNLLSNARQAMEAHPQEEPRLTLRAALEDGWVCLQVVDTGVGIAPDIREHLFTQGFTTRAEGHGIGLHSSALAVRLLGGRLSLDSEGLGHGTTATLLIPIHAPLAAAQR